MNWRKRVSLWFTNKLIKLVLKTPPSPERTKVLDSLLETRDYCMRKDQQ